MKIKTKKIKKINNKTRKNKILEDENKLSCALSNNIKLKHFAIKLLYFMLNYWKKNYPKKWKDILGDVLIEKTDKLVINKIGFTKKEYETLINFIDNFKKQDFYDYLITKFHKVTSALNNLAEPQFSFYHINSNKTLQYEFIDEVKKIFSAKNITWEDFKKMYLSTKDESERNGFNFMMYDLIYERKRRINSLYRKNLGNMGFIRNKLMVEIKNIKNFKRLNECNKDVIDSENYKDYGLYNSSSIYDINKLSPYAIIMKKYKEPYLGGPSGSTAVLYISLFTFYDYPETLKNKIFLLGLVIADYIPLWHTLPEILIVAYPEIEGKNIPVYRLSKDPVKYSKDLLKIVGL
jgi:hypothetical protein